MSIGGGRGPTSPTRSERGCADTGAEPAAPADPAGGATCGRQSLGMREGNTEPGRAGGFVASAARACSTSRRARSHYFSTRMHQPTVPNRREHEGQRKVGSKHLSVQVNLRERYGLPWPKQD